MSSKELIRRKEEGRFRVLNRTYELSDGDTYRSVSEERIAQDLQMDIEQVDQIVHYLTEEGLLNIPHAGRYISITHRGVVEVEEYIKNPDKGTEHFQFGNLTQHFYGNVGVNQTGSHNTAQVDMRTANDLAGIRQLIETLKELQTRLPPEVQAEYAAEVEDLEDVIKTPEKPNFLRKASDALKSIALIGTASTEIIQTADKIKLAVEKLIP